MPNLTCAGTQTIKQEPEEPQHHIDDLPLGQDGACSMYEDHQIKKEMVIGPTVFFRPNYEYSSTQTIKQDPEEPQHHVDDLHLSQDGACSLYEDHQIKEEIVIGPTVFFRPNYEYSSAAMQLKTEPSDNEETEKQTAENFEEVTEQNFPIIIKTHVLKLPVSEDNQPEVCNKTVSSKRTVKRKKTVNSSSNPGKIRSENGHCDTNRVNATFDCDRVLKYLCDICDYSTNSAKGFDLHLKAHASSIKFCCDMCSYICTQKFLLSSHLRAHSNDKPFVCKTCNAKFKRVHSLNLHLRIHTGMRPFACDVCHKSFRFRGNLGRHRRTHIGVKPYSCDICNKNFYIESELEKHRQTHTREKLYSCDVCYKQFNQETNLEEHRQIHIGQKLFSCNICHRYFTVKSNLDRHRRVHTEERPFSCDVCYKSFSQKNTLNRHHRQVHTGEKALF